MRGACDINKHNNIINLFIFRVKPCKVCAVGPAALLYKDFSVSSYSIWLY